MVFPVYAFLFSVGKSDLTLIPQMDGKEVKNPQPGDGLRSIKTTNVFRIINFELYAKPNAVVMAIGAVALLGSLGYIAYMRKKYEGMGYYAAVTEDGTEQFRAKKSNWD